MTGRRDDRSDEAKRYRRLYASVRWRGPRGRRTLQLAAHPLCAMCARHGRITAATVVDHVNPKDKATDQGFFTGPVQSLCDSPRYRCHSSRKQQQEKSGYHTALGPDGYPLDPLNPFNQ